MEHVERDVVGRLGTAAAVVDSNELVSMVLVEEVDGGSIEDVAELVLVMTAGHAVVVESENATDEAVQPSVRQ